MRQNVPMIRLGSSDLTVHPLCLGGNVFGWTADESSSFEVLDAYAAAGGNFIDTADAYSHWVPGNSGGESETIIGKWMASRGNRDSMVIATKMSHLPALSGLAPATIRQALDDSLRRLQTDRIDLYYAHYDDLETPQADTLGAFDSAIKEGKVRFIGASNFTAERLQSALDTSDSLGLARYVVLQNHYNLVNRGEYEGALRDVVERGGLVSLPYYSLASGFLTGKYREGSVVEGARAKGAGRYLDERGLTILAALDRISAAHGVSVTAVSLAWLAAQPTVATPIASARVVEQLPDLLQMTDLQLTEAELDELGRVSA
jgi:aryl-alcohol dehydrogenase-like predicted oxidoreductase